MGTDNVFMFAYDFFLFCSRLDIVCLADKVIPVCM